MVSKYSRPKRSKTKTKTKTSVLKTKTKTKTLAHETKTKTKTCQMGLETVSRPRHVSRPNITGNVEFHKLSGGNTPGPSLHGSGGEWRVDMEPGNTEKPLDVQ